MSHCLVRQSAPVLACIAMRGNLSAGDGNGRPVRELYPVDEVAQLLGDISQRKVWQLIASGEIGTVRLGTRRLVPRAELDKYLRKLAEAAA